MRALSLSVIATGLLVGCGSVGAPLAGFGEVTTTQGELQVKTFRPLEMPQSTNLVPPTPGGTNRADP